MFRSFALLIAMAAPMVAGAGSDFSTSLAVAREDAVALRSSADNLMMLARVPTKYSAETHSTELARAQELARRISDRLHDLQAVRDRATPAQVKELEAMSAQLQPILRELSAAIRAFNNRNGTMGLYAEAYQTNVAHLYEDTRSLASAAPAAAASAD